MPDSCGKRDLDIDSYVDERCVPGPVLQDIMAGREGESVVFDHEEPTGRFWSMSCWEENGPNHTGLLWSGSSIVPSEEHKNSASSYIIQTKTLGDGSWCITNQEFVKWANGEQWKSEEGDLVGTRMFQTPIGGL